MELNEWLDFIESFHPSEIKLGLERISDVAKKLNLLTSDSQIILVGGTNGKGSCVALLESLANNQNISFAAYTSPHLLSFNERIRINGENVSDDALIDAFESIELVRGQLPLTFFEFTTLAALWVFKKASPDLIILEVGLGGRLDAVNIMQPNASVITTIDYDHIDWLGDSLDKIGYEKAGIMRNGVPAFIGDNKSFKLLNELETVDTSCLFCVQQADNETKEIINNDGINIYRLLEQNIQLAVTVFKNIYPQSDINLTEVLHGVCIQGRFQRLNERIQTIVDVAHNPQSAQNLAWQLAQFKKQNNIRQVIAICGMMADKSIQSVLSALDPEVDCWNFVSLDMERAISAEGLQLEYQSLDNQVTAGKYVNVSEAYQDIERNCESEDLILVFGSFITVANMLQYIKLKNNQN